MPNYVAVGSEFIVNNVTFGTQSRADFARLTSGAFVAVWESTDGQQDASSGGIKGRLMAANGTPIGPEFLINTATANSQTYPSVTGLAGGGFLVTWTTRDALQDGSYDAIKAQRFDAAGAKVGAEFLVNSQTNNIQWISSAAGLDNGGFVIAWETYDSAQDGSGRAIKAQLYDAAGARAGTEFLVNTVTASDQMNADISALSGGRFIVTWLINIGGKLDVRAQVFDSGGAKLGGEIMVNSQTFESQTEVSVTSLANGGFVISWTTFDTAQDGSGNAIKAQVFDAAGAKVGSEILVNSAGASSQKTPSVAGLANGDFVIAWRTDDQSADDASGAIKAQVFSSTGAKLGGEFRANSLGASLESDPVVVDLGNGAFAIGWTGGTAPSWDNNIRAQIFSSGSAPVIQSDGGGASAALLVAEGTTAVTTVQAFDIDGPATTYSIAGGADAALFAIDAATGALTFVAAPDFGAPADADVDNVYEVVVRASDGERFDEQAIEVAIESTNDAVAIVSDGGGESAALGVAEGATHVTTVVATDGDGDPILYSIAGGADAARFAIDPDTGVLAFVSPQDHESPTDANGDNLYEVIVQASDGELDDRQALTITVGDVNEAPSITFHNWPASETIISSVPEGWSNYALFGAIDPEGDTLTWTLSGQDASLFTYDPATGWLRFNAVPDYEAPGSVQGTNTYSLTLSVSDGGLGDSVGLTIHIRNVNEGLAIASLGGGDTASVTVDENATGVAAVFAVDLDGDAPVYSIAGGADAGRFIIDAATGALAFAAAPDREAPADADGDNVYEVMVRATDGQLSDHQTIAVTVGNVDEAIEIFSYGGAASVALTMAENGPAVGDVEASDADFDPIAFAITGGADAALFAIDAASGALTFVGRPDFEAPGDAGGDNVYNVVVTASSPTSSDSQAFAVTIVNENEGIFITSNGGGTSAALSTLEGESHVTTVVAHDPDGTAPVYSIIGGPDADRFTIDAQTGVLTFIDVPDHEAPADAAGANFYTVQVAASDGEFTTWQSIQIMVGNVDEAVTITSHAGADHVALSVGENSLPVSQVAAVDADGGPVSYAITGGADAALFTIDEETGALTFIEGADYEAPADADEDNVYAVVVTATDGGFTDSQAFAITVTGVNEAVAIGSNGGGASAAVARAENGLAVTTVTAADPDGDAVTYAIAGGADAARFTIDASTGALAFISAPDFEAPADAGANNVYDVIVSASDGAFTDSQAIAVSVGNVNEPVAIISGGGGASAAVSIAENSTAATNVAATDADGDAVTYAIAGGVDAARFTIDAATGALAFVSVPNFEAPADAGANNVYDVIVSASDGTFTDSQAIAVTVGNANEPVAIISGGGGASAAVAVAENGSAITTVAAIDADGGAVTYGIAGGADAARFTINAATGALAFVSAPNFEAPADAGANNVYDVIVSASDGAFTDTQAIAVTVGNVNEPVAIISGGGGASAAVSIAENSLVATNVAATDADGGAVAYAIAGGADAARFTINAATGALAFVAAPDFEAPADAGANNVYDVIVSASDGTFSDTQALAVTVTNVREGNTITGTSAGDTIAMTKTVAGQPYATNLEDTIYGLGGADTLLGGGGDDYIDGGSGNDAIIGGPGADTLLGGTGADRFKLTVATDSPVAAPDVVMDFSRSQTDRIDLSDLDARTNASGNQSFTFIGTAAFSGVSGQLRYQQSGGNTFVTGDVNGDRVADFQVQLQGLVPLTSADFVL